MFAASRLSYKETNAFSKIALDYLNGAPQLRGFYAQPPGYQGIEDTMVQKRLQACDRKTLVQALRDQYKLVIPTAGTEKNIESLLSENSYTVTTAHQPNLFTGPLYFVYKIMHAIKLAAELNSRFPANHFVPVYYMGSEDADFAELNHTYVAGKKFEWEQSQQGAVGKMKVDKPLQRLITELQGQVSVEPHGAELTGLLQKAYAEGRTIQEATFYLLNELFGSFGLVVLIPDDPRLKGLMHQVFEQELFENISYGIVSGTSRKLQQHYDTQAYPRDINLFYLRDDVRERIEKKADRFVVLNTGLSFSEAEMREELRRHPERFSPNVILRGLYQETILPNLVFIGGGGELAYWLQLKELFDHYGIVYPVLMLRNSFLLVEKKWEHRMKSLGLGPADFFRPAEHLVKELVVSRSQNTISLNGNFEKADELFEEIRLQAGRVDPTLLKHVSAIKARALKTLQELEKKMYRAEKRKFSAQQNQVQAIREALFPLGKLQERSENLSMYYAKWGRSFLEVIYRHSLPVEQEFTILVQQDEA